MEPLKVIKSHYTPSLAVTNWHSISQIAEEMDKLVKSQEHSLAMHHAYVAEKPMNFFVVNEVTLKDFIPGLESKYIVNPKIESFVKDSIMSLPEGCAMFPFRSAKKVNRAFILKVSYEVPDPLQPNGLRKIEHKEVDRIIAQVFQHEIDHANGKNIFFNGPKV